MCIFPSNRMVKFLVMFKNSTRMFNIGIGNSYSDGMPRTYHVQTLIYADDLSLFTPADDINLAASRLKHSITNVNNW